jgi:hypothetical protein
MKPMACLMYHPFQAGLIDGAMPQLTATSSPQLNLGLKNEPGWFRAAIVTAPK